MATITTWTWNVNTVDTYPSHTDDNDVTESDVIYNVHWRLTGSDGTNEVTNIGTINLDVSDLSTFSDFDDVTSSDVEGWVETAIGSDSLADIKASIQTQVDEISAPTSVTRTIGESTSTPEE